MQKMLKRRFLMSSIFGSPYWIFPKGSKPIIWGQNLKVLLIGFVRIRVEEICCRY